MEIAMSRLRPIITAPSASASSRASRKAGPLPLRAVTSPATIRDLTRSGDGAKQLGGQGHLASVTPCRGRIRHACRSRRGCWHGPAEGTARQPAWRVFQPNAVGDRDGTSLPARASAWRRSRERRPCAGFEADEPVARPRDSPLYDPARNLVSAELATQLARRSVANKLGRGRRPAEKPRTMASPIVRSNSPPAFVP